MKNIQFLIAELMAHTICNYFKRFPTKYTKEPDIWTKIAYISDSYVHTYSRPEFKYLIQYLSIKGFICLILLS